MANIQELMDCQEINYKTLPLQHIENYGKGCLKEFANVFPDQYKFINCIITI
jgi:hypothetical protein